MATSAHPSQVSRPYLLFLAVVGADFRIGPRGGRVPQVSVFGTWVLHSAGASGSVGGFNGLRRVATRFVT
jgi:hypothetical protein